MVTYSSTNTKRARPNISELPRTDIQWLAAPFPSLLYGAAFLLYILTMVLQKVRAQTEGIAAPESPLR